MLLLVDEFCESNIVVDALFVGVDVVFVNCVINRALFGVDDDVVVVVVVVVAAADDADKDRFRDNDDDDRDSVGGGGMAIDDDDACRCDGICSSGAHVGQNHAPHPSYSQPTHFSPSPFASHSLASYGLLQ